MYLPFWIGEVWYSFLHTGNKELLRAKVLQRRSNLDTQTFWYKKVDQNISPPFEKSPENFAKSNFGELFGQVVTYLNKVKNTA